MQAVVMEASPASAASHASLALSAMSYDSLSPSFMRSDCGHACVHVRGEWMRWVRHSAVTMTTGAHLSHSKRRVGVVHHKRAVFGQDGNSGRVIIGTAGKAHYRVALGDALVRLIGSCDADAAV